MLVFLVHMPVHCIISQLKRVVVLETAIQIYATVLHATVCMWMPGWQSRTVASFDLAVHGIGLLQQQLIKNPETLCVLYIHS